MVGVEAGRGGGVVTRSSFRVVLPCCCGSFPQVLDSMCRYRMPLVYTQGIVYCHMRPGEGGFTYRRAPGSTILELAGGGGARE